jgi:hypothetical protein
MSSKCHRSFLYLLPWSFSPVRRKIYSSLLFFIRTVKLPYGLTQWSSSTQTSRSSCHFPHATHCQLDMMGSGQHPYSITVKTATVMSAEMSESSVRSTPHIYYYYPVVYGKVFQVQKLNEYLSKHNNFIYYAELHVSTYLRSSSGSQLVLVLITIQWDDIR